MIKSGLMPWPIVLGIFTLGFICGVLVTLFGGIAFLLAMGRRDKD